MNQNVTVILDDDRNYDVRIDQDMTDEHVARLLDQLEFLTEHPDRHDQTLWFELGDEHKDKLPEPDEDSMDPVPVRAVLGSIDNCGSTGCLAGWTVLRTVSIPLVNIGGRDVYPGVQRADGSWRIEETNVAAARYLGLSVFNRGALFDGDNTLADLWRLSAVITGARIKIPADVQDGPLQLQIDPRAAELLAYAELD